MVHRLDRDRAMCTTVAPANRQAAQLALLAFNLEIATIPELVSESMLGEIRLQWWRDTIANIFSGTGSDHPVARGLAHGINTYGLDKSLFDEYLDARSFDLRREAPASIVALESYAAGTAGSLNELLADALGLADLAPGPQAAIRIAVRHSGIAWALSGLLQSVSFHARQGRSYLPTDIDEDNKRQAVAEAARRHIIQARTARKLVPKSLLPVMLPTYLAEQRLQTGAPHTGKGRRLMRFYGKVLLRSY